jgi:hypothetical protein
MNHFKKVTTMRKKKPSINLASVQRGTSDVDRPVDKLKKKVQAEKQVPFQFYCDASLLKKLKMLSIETERSVASLVREGIEHVLKKHS